MSLHQLQCALAELVTDRDAREQFDRDGAGFASARGLSARECEQLEVLRGSAIAGYAATLVRKRRAEAARLLPKTQAVLGEEFATTFAEWAERASLPPGLFRYARDAGAFARYLLTEQNTGKDAKAAIRADRAQLGAAMRPKWLKTLLSVRRS
jgi:hypothetical protein